LLVAGGGAAGGHALGTETSGSGGGGGGGVITAELNVTPGAVMAITVGAGGTWTLDLGDAGLAARKGKDSVFGPLVAKGGGTGQSNVITQYGLTNEVFPAGGGQEGGSGGGAVGGYVGQAAGGNCDSAFSTAVSDPEIRHGGGSIAGQGNVGGSWNSADACARSGGGGGGAKTAGASISAGIAAELGHGGDGFTMAELGWPGPDDYIRDRGVYGSNDGLGDIVAGDRQTQTMEGATPTYHFVATRTFPLIGINSPNPRDSFGIEDPPWRLLLDAAGGGGGGGLIGAGTLGGIGGGANGMDNAGTAPGVDLKGGGAGGARTGGADGGDGIIILEYVDAIEQDCDTTHIDRIVYDLARRAGIPSHRIDLAGIATESDFGELTGLGIGRPATSRSVVEILQRHSFFDLADIGGRLIGTRRDRQPDGTIGGDDLRGHVYGESPPSIASREREEDYELPRAVRVTYSQAQAEYEPGTEGYSRRVTDADQVIDIDLSAIAMHPDEAAARAEISALEQIIMREQTDVTLVATEANKSLKPGDVKTLDVRGRLDPVRITEMAYVYPVIVKLKVHRHDGTTYYSDAIGGGRDLPGSVVYTPGATTFELMDAPLVREHDDVPGYFAALGGNPSVVGLIEGWPGGDLLRQEPAGWEEIERVLKPGCGFGTAVTTLADGEHTIVNDQSLTVSASPPVLLEAATMPELCLGANLAAVEVRSGGTRIGWELIRYLDVAESGGNWVLSGLVRGVNGTEWAMALHQIGDRVIFLGGEGQVIASLDELGESRNHNATTLGAVRDPLNDAAFAWEGVDRIPYAPCHLTAERDSGDDLILTWNRRDRVGLELSGTLPLSEDSEAYEVDIYNGAGDTVLRTLAVTSEEATYTAAQQTTDFGSHPATLIWDVRQMSALGRGYARRITSEDL
jgi:hypothetical protein